MRSLPAFLPVLLSGLACGASDASSGAAHDDAGPARPSVVSCGPGSWRPGPRLNDPREAAGTVLLPDGRVLVVAGHFIDPPAQRDLDSAEIFDPLTETWTPTGSLNHPRGTTLGCTLLSGGDVLLAQHENVNFQLGTREFIPGELYHPSSGTWSRVELMTTNLNGPLVALPDGGAIVMGGSDWLASVPYDGAERYDASTGTWSPTGPLRAPRLGFGAVALGARVLVYGGSSVYAEHPGNEPLQRMTEIYDADTGLFREVGSLNQGRWAPGVALADGRVLVAGGDRGDGRSAEIFDPETEKWTPTGSLHERRQGTLTLLADGRVLAAGGGGAFDDLDTAETYDPRTETWSPAGTLPGRRRLHSAVRLPNGEVLVVGGYHHFQLSTTAIYTPCTVDRD